MNALMIDEKDNVVVVTEDVVSGTEIQYAAGDKICTLAAVKDIPIYHKAAIREIEKGALVIKYGQTIGRATCRIREGEHVHCHNVESAASR